MKGHGTKKQFKSSGKPCKSTSSGGAFKCALADGHYGPHWNAENGVKAKQSARWQQLVDGRVEVTTFNHGKKMAEWHEGEASAPAAAVPARQPTKLEQAGYCGAEFESLTTSGHKCTLTAGHDGLHANTPTGAKECPDDDLEADAAARGPVHMLPSELPRQEDEDDAEDPYEDEVRSDEDRAFARQQREAREAHAREIEQAEAAPVAPVAVTTAKIGDYAVHPAAAKFDMLDGASWESFREDVRSNGQREPVVLIGQQILDGRNRLRACLDLGIAPRFRNFGDDPGDGTDPIRFVVSVNIQRRHMDETQRSFVGAELVPMYEQQARERQLAGKSLPPNSAEGQGEAVELAARAVNVGKTSVKAAIAVTRDAAPEVVAASKAGRLKVSAAAELATLPKQQQREIVKKVGGGEIRPGKVRALVKQEKKRDIVRKINEDRVQPMPAGRFGVIYADYPWKFDNSDQHEGSRGHMGYPPMTMEQILDHAHEAAKRADRDCIVALWVTNAHIVEVGNVIKAFGAEHRTMYTWPKPKIGPGTWGRGQTEHLIIASIGAPVHTLNEVSTLLPSFKPQRIGEHSSKPAEVAELLRKHCAGPFLELFGREPREGWSVWGAEADKFATEAA